MPTQAQRPRIPETSDNQRKARLAWNAGETGASRPPVISPIVERCTVDGCGTTADQPKPRPGMQLVPAQGQEPGRWYCPGRCTAIGQAITDLRTGGHR
ncbi:hypothetical protein OG742_37370 [Streptomyces sp. NBC_00828]|uniref:hypothetical protein n=1 Tax=Streptomyces sp. NBC_00828 TaxID=2903678 RepID=UPI003862E27F